MRGKKLIQACIKTVLGCLLLGSIVTLTACQSFKFGMLDPKGIISFEERKLFFDTLALMLIVVLPVIIMSLTFVYHYKASHRIRDYKPNWSHNHLLESLWWGIPCVIIVVLAILTWKKTYELDPYNRIQAAGNQKPLLIQAISLPWKWLFIYPEYNIATVNYLEIPVGQPVEYWLTSDNAAMTAFFIPQIGSQIYAQEGMRTRLFLLSNYVGEYIGMNTLFNGDGFAQMRFPVHVVQPNEMQQWVDNIKKSPQQLTEESYKQLVIPSKNDQPKFFAGVPNNLFLNVIEMYMHSTGTSHPRENIQKVTT